MLEQQQHQHHPPLHSAISASTMSGPQKSPHKRKHSELNRPSVQMQMQVHMQIQIPAPLHQHTHSPAAKRQHVLSAAEAPAAAPAASPHHALSRIPSSPIVLLTPTHRQSVSVGLELPTTSNQTTEQSHCIGEHAFRTHTGMTLRAKSWSKNPIYPPKDAPTWKLVSPTTHPPHDDASSTPKGGPDCVLALHGYLDNASTFDLLTPPLLASNTFTTIVAPDLPGHGLSTHRPAMTGYYLWDTLDDILSLLDTLQWNTCTLIGHSTGGHIASLFTATFPARVSRLIMLESIGTAVQFKHPDHVEMAGFIHKRRLLHETGRGTRVYESFEEAAKARCRGFTKVSLEASRVLCERGLEPVIIGETNNTTTNNTNNNVATGASPRMSTAWNGGQIHQPINQHHQQQQQLSEQPYIWRTDPRLTLWTYLHAPESTLLSAFDSIHHIPTLVLLADRSGIFDVSIPKYKHRLAALGRESEMVVVVVAGGHHVHLERATVGCVAGVVQAWIGTTTTTHIGTELTHTRTDPVENVVGGVKGVLKVLKGEAFLTPESP
ncbi:Alpha/Beta hydrolase protein [Gaertneriomyces semiglobifer]|nr:Alpha/Beta hydrolase protein [Gaertneriomyces semiglobifer]